MSATKHSHSNLLRPLFALTIACAATCSTPPAHANQLPLATDAADVPGGLAAAGSDEPKGKVSLKATRITIRLSDDSAVVEVGHTIKADRAVRLPIRSTGGPTAETLRLSPGDRWTLRSDPIEAVDRDDEILEVPEALKRRYRGLDVTVTLDDGETRVGRLFGVDRTRLVLIDPNDQSKSVVNLSSVDRIVPEEMSGEAPRHIVATPIGRQPPELVLRYPLSGDPPRVSYRLIRGDEATGVRLRLHVTLTNRSLYRWPAGTPVEVHVEDRANPLSVSSIPAPAGIDASITVDLPIEAAKLEPAWLVRFSRTRGIESQWLRWSVDGSRLAAPITGGLTLDEGIAEEIETSRLVAGEPIRIVYRPLRRFPRQPEIEPTRPRPHGQLIVQSIRGTTLDVIPVGVQQFQVTSAVPDAASEVERPWTARLPRWVVNQVGRLLGGSSRSEQVPIYFEATDESVFGVYRRQAGQEAERVRSDDSGAYDLGEGLHSLAVATKMPERIDARLTRAIDLQQLDLSGLGARDRERVQTLIGLVESWEAVESKLDSLELQRGLAAQSRAIDRGGAFRFELTESEKAAEDVWRRLNRRAADHPPTAPVPTDLDTLFDCLDPPQK